MNNHLPSNRASGLFPRRRPLWCSPGPYASVADAALATFTGRSIVLASTAVRPTPITTPPARESNRPLETPNGPPVFGRLTADKARLSVMPSVAPACPGAGVLIAMAPAAAGGAEVVVGLSVDVVV